MKNLQFLLLLSLPLLCLGLRSASAAANTPAAPVVEGEVLIGVQPSSARFDKVSIIVNALGRVVGEQSSIHAFRIRLNRGVSMQYALDRFRRQTEVTYVEPNHILQAVATPNDPSWGGQYGPKKLQVDRAWDLYEPQAQIVVAVVDTGVDYDHPDLSSVLYRDVSGAVIGYNVLDDTTDAEDDKGHGTHCAGIIAARINNGVGVAGVAGWNPLMAGAENYVKIMPVKVLNSAGNGTDAGVASGIIWAADHGAKVISLSLGGAVPSTTTSNAVNYAWNKGCTVVAAAGNSGVSTQFYPAAFPNVISVGATDGSDTLASFSNFGPWVKVAAPGVGIYSTYLNGGYTTMNGTSMAAPHVAGLAALLRSQSPNLSNSQINSLITGNVDPYFTSAGHTLGAVAGRVNAYRALLAARGNTVPNITVPLAPGNLQATAGNSQVTLTWAASAGATSYTVKRSTTSGYGYAAVSTGVLAGSSFTDTSVKNGTTYYYVVSALTAAGESANSSQVAASPSAPLPSVPAAPLNPQVTPGDARVSLTWTASAGATSYAVKRSSTSGSGYSVIASGLTSTSYLDQSVTNGSTYYYVVSAVNSGGESANSAQVSATPKPSLSGSPLNVTAVGGNARVNLSWSAAAGAFVYRVKRATVSGGPYATIVNQLTAISHVDTSVTNGTTYYYVVSALTASGESANSPQVVARPSAPLPAAPAAPLNPQATAGDTRVSLTWAASTGATSYAVKRSSTSGSGYSVITSGLASTSYLDQSVTNGSTYYYVVSAVNSGGESGNSVQVSATPKPTLPGAPLNVTAAGGNARVDLTWSAAAGASTYRVKRSITSGGPYSLVGDQLTSTSYADTAVSNGTTYYYVVVGVNLSGEGTASAQVSATPKPSLPGAPLNLSAVAGNARVDLTWSAVAGAAAYCVKRATTSGGVYTVVEDQLAATSYADLAVNNGVTYYYVVSAVNGGGESANSAQVSATPKPSLPGTPLNVTAVGGNARVDLTWGAVAGAALYRVKRATVSGGPYATVVDELTTTSYADANVTSGTTYYYVVSALNAGGESANSPQVVARPSAPLPAAPAAPLNPQATAGDTRVSLAWAASTGATSYVVKRSSTSGSGYSVIASGLTSTSYLDQSVTNGSTYYYVVSAVNSGGESGNSVQVSAIPEPLLPGAPLNVTAMAGNTRVDLAWGAVTDAAAYCVKRATTSGGPYTVVGDQLTANSYSDLAVSNGVTYYYVVIAVNSAGAGAASAQVSALPAAPTVQPVFKATTSAGSASVTPGKATTVATTITCTAAPPATAQVVVQVYNSAGALVGQKVTPNQVFTIGQGRWFGYIWTAPSVSGTYRVRVAVLSADGSKTYYANDSAVSVVVR